MKTSNNTLDFQLKYNHSFSDTLLSKSCAYI